jgi:hypothetical protein
MYYTVIEDRSFPGTRRWVYTGMESKTKEGLIERAKYAFPQYENLKVIECEGEMIDAGWDVNNLPF